MLRFTTFRNQIMRKCKTSKTTTCRRLNSEAPSVLKILRVSVNVVFSFFLVHTVISMTHDQIVEVRKICAFLAVNHNLGCNLSRVSFWFRIYYLKNMTLEISTTRNCVLNYCGFDSMKGIKVGQFPAYITGLHPQITNKSPWSPCFRLGLSDRITRKASQ